MQIKYDYVLLFFIACMVIAAAVIAGLIIFFPCECEPEIVELCMNIAIKE